MATSLFGAMVHPAGASPVDSDTLVYLSGGGTSNEATASGALTVSKGVGSFSQISDVSASTLHDGADGAVFTNEASLAVGGTKSCIQFADGGETPYCRGSYTFECIFRTTSTQSENPYIFRHSGGWMLQFANNCSSIVLWYPGWTLRGQSSTGINDGSWHHLAVVQDIATGKVSFFVDYALVSQTDVDLGSSPSSTDIFLGAFDKSANNSLLNSAYDEVRLTKRALAPREFLMNEAVFVRERRKDAVIDSDTLAYVPFDAARFVFDENVARERNASLPSVNLTVKAATVREASGMSLYSSPLAASTAVENASSLHAATNSTVGSSGYLAMTSGLDYLRDDFTMEIFVRADSLSCLRSHADDPVYVFDGTAFCLQWGSDGKTSLYDVDAVWNLAGSSENLVDGQWHHLAVVWEQDALTLSYYVDHRLLSSYIRSEDMSGYTPTGLYVNNSRWGLEATSIHTAGDAHFDEFRLTRRALKATEFLSQRRYPVDDGTLYYNSFDMQRHVGDVDLPVRSIRVGNYVANGGRQETTNTPVSATLYSAALNGIAFGDNGALYMEKLANDISSVGGGYILTNVPPSFAERSFTYETFFRLDRAPTGQSYFLAYVGVGFVYVNTSGSLCASVKNFSQPLIGGGTNVVDGAWHHLAVVRDQVHGTVGVYLDYRRIGWLEGCASIVADGQTPSSEIYIGGYGRVEGSGTIYALQNSFTEVWMDELRITGRALKPTEFLALSPFSADPLLYARYEGSWAATSPGPYAVDGEPSGAAAFSRQARVSGEIRDAEGNALAADTAGLSLSGGVVTYQANGAFDAESATTEVFIKGRSASSADANVIAFAKMNDVSTPVWSLSADGTFAVHTAADGRTFDLSSSLGMVDGMWHHLAVSYSPTGNDTAVKVWWDYANVLDTTVSGAIDFSSAAGFVLGSDAFTGAMDELRMSVGVLSPADFLHSAPPNGSMIIIW